MGIKLHEPLRAHSLEKTMAYQNIKVETRDKVGVITFNRPESLNALNSEIIDELNRSLASYDADKKIGCIVLTGADKAFAAGADIKELAENQFVDAYLDNMLGDWDMITNIRKPIIAAVSGYALGGGCEVAMMCDMIIAADTAKFGLPEVTLGVMPGAGGTQRLTRYVGKSKAMEMCLTGRFMDAEEAERSGLISRIVPANDLLEETFKVADKIADLSPQSVLMIKESVNRAYETMLLEGIRVERRLFQSLFATQDQKEGMKAFIEKREPHFKGT